MAQIGRINKLKGAEDALRAFIIIKQRFPESVLWFVGAGNDMYVSQLKKIAQDSGVLQSVIFYGFVSEAEKFKFLARAHLLLVPSVHEGWGLVVTEANYVGTPAIAYRVAGLQDVVQEGENGILTSPDPSSLAEGCINLIKDPKKLHELSITSRHIAETYDWDQTADRALSFMVKSI